MKIRYIKYQISGHNGPQKIIERGQMEIPENGHGIRYNLRQMFPGYDFSKMTVGKENYRMHNSDWTCGIAIMLVNENRGKE